MATKTRFPKLLRHVQIVFWICQVPYNVHQRFERESFCLRKCCFVCFFPLVNLQDQAEVQITSVMLTELKVILIELYLKISVLQLHYFRDWGHYSAIEGGAARAVTITTCHESSNHWDVLLLHRGKKEIHTVTPLVATDTGLRTPGYCGIQRDLSGGNKLNQYCVNSFGKGF